MILYVIRHAWAGHHGDPQWPDDFQRPLAPQGRERLAKLVDLLASRGFAPELVATSPLVRCRQTADVVVERVAKKCKTSGPRLVELDALAPGSDLESLLAWTVDEASDCGQVAWVGHAPDVGYLTAALIGSPQGWIRFAKGAVGAVRFDELPTSGQGELRWLATAKLLGC